jgi:hypothetical protein
LAVLINYKRSIVCVYIISNDFFFPFIYIISQAIFKKKAPQVPITWDIFLAERKRLLGLAPILVFSMLLHTRRRGQPRNKLSMRNLK